MFMLLLFPTHNSTIAQTAQKTQAQTIAGLTNSLACGII